MTEVPLPEVLPLLWAAVAVAAVGVLAAAWGLVASYLLTRKGKQ